jgi:hypothetical protein
MEIRRKYTDPLCKGCWLSNIPFHFCSFALRNIQDKCPCAECLVKMICAKSCEKRQLTYMDCLHYRKDD